MNPVGAEGVIDPEATPTDPRPERHPVDLEAHCCAEAPHLPDRVAHPCTRNPVAEGVGSG
jgi:hypothetical protein